MLFYYNMESKAKTSRKILIIAGPTGVGKSNAAFEAAKKLGGEIVSADSMQFYREINIGTDKVPLRMRREVPHYFVDSLSIKDSFDVHSFTCAAVEIVKRILDSDKVPVITGGSGLYLRGLIKGIFPIPGKNREEERAIRESLEKKGVGELREQLKSVDPASAERIHGNDRRRISRALEVYLLTGKTISFWHSQESGVSLEKIGTPLYFILTRDREVLYNRINERVDRMFEEGWIEEVVKLKEAGCSRFLKRKAPIGYVEILDYLEGGYSIDELKEVIKKKTRIFARKQLTWFRRENGVWINLGEGKSADESVIREFIESGKEDT